MFNPETTYKDEDYRVEILPEDYPQYDLSFKLIFIGDSSVGKSCLTTKAVKNEFEDYYQASQYILLEEIVFAVLSLEHHIFWRYLLACLHVAVHLVVEAALQFGTHASQFLWVGRDILQTCCIGADT